jgi:GGDEF domain-containing protein
VPFKPRLGVFIPLSFVVRSLRPVMSWDDTDVRICVRPFLATPAALVVVHTPDSSGMGLPIRVARTPLWIGRSGDVSLSGDPSLSNRHCVIHRDGEDFFVTDHESTNGSFLNDNPMPITSAPLRSADRLCIAGHVLKFLCGPDIVPRILETTARLLVYDGLTDLPNGRLCLRQVRRRLDDLQTTGSPLALVSIAVRDLGGVRDGYLDGGCNVALRTIARRLRGYFTVDCTRARVSEARFLVFVPGADQTRAPIVLGPMEAIGRAVEIGGDLVDIAVDVQLWTCPTPGEAPGFLERVVEIVQPPEYCAIFATHPSNLSFALTLNAELRHHTTRLPWLLSGCGAFTPHQLGSALGDTDGPRCIALVLSKDALLSPTIEHEIEEALHMEAITGQKVLLPITLDRYVFDSWSPTKEATKRALLDRDVFDFTKSQLDYFKFCSLVEMLVRAGERPRQPDCREGEYSAEV